MITLRIEHRRLHSNIKDFSANFCCLVLLFLNGMQFVSLYILVRIQYGIHIRLACLPEIQRSWLNKRSGTSLSNVVTKNFNPCSLIELAVMVWRRNVFRSLLISPLKRARILHWARVFLLGGQNVCQRSAYRGEKISTHDIASPSLITIASWEAWMLLSV